MQRTTFLGFRKRNDAVNVSALQEAAQVAKREKEAALADDYNVNRIYTLCTSLSTMLATTSLTTLTTAEEGAGIGSLATTASTSSSFPSITMAWSSISSSSEEKEGQDEAKQLEDLKKTIDGLGRGCLNARVNLQMIYVGVLLSEWYLQKTNVTERPSSDLNAQLALAHVEIWLANSLLSEPYHLQRAHYLLNLIVQQKAKEQAKRGKQKGRRGGVMSLASSMLTMNKKVKSKPLTSHEMAMASALAQVPLMHCKVLLYLGEVKAATEATTSLLDRLVRNEDEAVDDDEDEENLEADPSLGVGNRDAKVSMVRLLLACCYMASQQFDKAIEVINDIFPLGPQARPRGFSKFDLYFILGRIKELRLEEVEGKGFVQGTWSYEEAFAVALELQPELIELAEREIPNDDFGWVYDFSEEAVEEAEKQRLENYMKSAATADISQNVSTVESMLSNHLSWAMKLTSQAGIRADKEEYKNREIAALGETARMNVKKAKKKLQSDNPQVFKIVQKGLIMKDGRVKLPPMSRKEKWRARDLAKQREEDLEAERLEDERLRLQEEEDARQAIIDGLRDRIAAARDWWIQDSLIWRGVADKCLVHGMPHLAADLYREAISRVSSGFAKAALWAAWAKATQRCGHEYDAKIAAQHALFIAPTESAYLSKVKDHLDVYGTTTVDLRNKSVSLIKGEVVRAVSVGDSRFSAKNSVCEKSYLSVASALGSILSFLPSKDETIHYAAIRIQSLLRRNQKLMTWRREQAEILRLSKLAPQRTPTIVWNTPADVFYPTKLGNDQLNARCVEVSGQFVYAPSDPDTLELKKRYPPLQTGRHELKCTFYPSDTDVYKKATSSVWLTVRKNNYVPVIVWDKPHRIHVGIELGEEQLCAKVMIDDVVLSHEELKERGTLEYRPALGLELPIGVHRLRAIYTPFDLRNFVGSEKCVDLSVESFKPEITWTPPASITYPSRLTPEQLNASCIDTQGTFVYTPSIRDHPLPVGRHELLCVFWPYRQRLFGEVEKRVEIEVIKPYPVIVWPTPPSIYSHERFSYQTHLNAWVDFVRYDDVPDLEGTFIYSVDEQTSLPPGRHVLSVTFTPDDLDNYHCSEASVQVLVRCKPKIDWRPPSKTLRFGNPILKETLNAHCRQCEGTFVYSPDVDEVPDQLGLLSFCVTFTPLDLFIYDVVEAHIEIDMINKAKPDLHWAPSPIGFGTLISVDNVLNATANVPGTWTYEGYEQGVVLPVGKYILTVTFAPDDDWNYQSTTLVATILVEKLVVELSWGPLADIAYGVNLTKEAHLLATITNPPSHLLPSTTQDSSFGSFVYSHEPGTLLKAGMHELSVTYTPTDTNNYLAATVKVRLRVKKFLPEIIWKAPRSIPYGDVLTPLQLNARIGINSGELGEEIEGEITYEPPLDHRYPIIGRHMLTCKFVPIDSRNYSENERIVELSVRKATPKISWPKLEDLVENMPLEACHFNATCDFPSLTKEDGELVYDHQVGRKLEMGEHTIICKFKPHPDVVGNFDVRKSIFENKILIVPNRGKSKIKTSKK